MRTIVAAALVLSVGGLAGASGLPVYHDVTGQDVPYVVQAGDNLGGIASRFGMKVALAATINRLADPHRLSLGQTLRLSSQHVIPAKLDDGLIINIAERALYWFKAKQLVARFPAGVGRADWETPPGRFTITGRRRKPTWHVPRAIQAEMRERGEPVRTKVPPGPDNPLGEYWLQLSAGDYGIHGTNAPWSVGKSVTHGCIRLRPQDVERLFNEVPTGTPVWVIDEPIKLADLPDGRILIEAHPDIYEHANQRVGSFETRVTEAGLAERIDLARTLAVIKDAWGIPVDITREPIAPQP